MADNPKDWDDLFDVWAVKTVAPNDVEKEAYVVNREQRRVLEAAGIEPAHGGGGVKPFRLAVLNDDIDSVEASYYQSLREGANRAPEYRMGRQFISEWLRAGDELLLGCVGGRLFAMKLGAREADCDELLKRIARGLPDGELWRRAAQGKREPARKERTYQDFERSPYVVEAALRRAGDVCEFPGCGPAPFRKPGGEPYLEVHHIVPLAEGGPDATDNVAALCPNCHREQHHGADRMAKRWLLAEMAAGREDPTV